MSDAHTALSALHRELAVKRTAAGDKYMKWRDTDKEMADYYLGIYAGLRQSMDLVMEHMHVARVAKATEAHALRMVGGA